MNKIIISSRIFRLLSIFVLVYLSMVNTGVSSEVKGITKPQKDVFLAFTVSGKISEIVFEEGDKVEKGDVIATLETLPEEIRLRQLVLEMDKKAEIEAAVLELQQKENDMVRMVTAHVEGAASDSELDNAKLAVEVNKLRLKLAQHENALNALRYEELKEELRRRKLVSPITGVIEILELDIGETVEALRPVVRVVVTNRLWVDLMVPLRLLPVIREIPEISVRFPTYGDVVKADIVKGRIDYIAAMADAASETVKIRIDIENPGRWPIGTPVVVELPDLKSDKNSQNTKGEESEKVENSAVSTNMDDLFKPILAE